jgi:Rrf2 family protein
MMKLNRKIEYALMALNYIYFENKKKNRPIPIREIIDTVNIPFDTTSKVMQMLSANGIVKSIQGAKGGYMLEKSLANISYYSLANIIEDKMHLVGCLDEKSGCELAENCNIISPMRNFNYKFESFLKDISILELIDPPPVNNLKQLDNSFNV